MNPVSVFPNGEKEPRGIRFCRKTNVAISIAKRAKVLQQYRAQIGFLNKQKVESNSEKIMAKHIKSGFRARASNRL